MRLHFWLQSVGSLLPESEHTGAVRVPEHGSVRQLRRLADTSTRRYVWTTGHRPVSTGVSDI